MPRPTPEQRIELLRRRIEMTDDLENLLADPRWLSLLELVGEHRMLIIREIASPDAKHLDYNRGRLAILDQLNLWIQMLVAGRDRLNADLAREKALLERRQ